MSLLSDFKNKVKNKNIYLIFVRCPNCGANSEVRVPKGIAVDDYVKSGKCKCDTCEVVFSPNEYTTEEFDKRKRLERVKKEIAHLPKPIAKPKALNDFKEERKGADIKWI